MIEIAALATSVVTSFLVPLLKSGADGLMDQLTTKTTDAAATGLVDTAKRLWQRVRGKAEGTDDNEIVALFERRPEMMQGALETVVRQLLEQDPAFHQEISALVEQPATDSGTTRWQIMADTVGVINAQGAHMSGGKMVGVEIGSRPAPPVAPEEP